MKISPLAPHRTALFDCSSENGRRLLRSLLGAAGLALGISLLLSGLAPDIAWGQTAATSPLPTVTAQPAKPTLRSNVAVPDAIVTIGDFFEDAGDKAATPLFRAPDLGTTGAVPARRVVELARAAGLVGADAGDLVEIQVSRLSRDVEADELARLIAAEALRQNGRALSDATVDDLRVAFDGPVEPRHADLHATTPARIVSLTHNPQSGRFDALVMIDQGSGSDRVRLRGEIIETVQTATLTRQLGRGEVVGRDDVVVDRLPRRLVGGLRAVDPAQIIGLAARRQLRAGQPVSTGDFARPQVVARGDTVTIVYETANLVVTSRGQAQDAGAVGDLVSVVNPQSKRTLHATVAGPGKVVVSIGAQTVASISRTNP